MRVTTHLSLTSCQSVHVLHATYTVHSLGGHFQALLKELAERGVSSGVLAAPASWSPVPPSVVVSQWVGTWRSRISTWLHSALSRRLLRSYHSDLLLRPAFLGRLGTFKNLAHRLTPRM